MTRRRHTLRVLLLLLLVISQQVVTSGATSSPFHNLFKRVFPGDGRKKTSKSPFAVWREKFSLAQMPSEDSWQNILPFSVSRQSKEDIIVDATKQLVTLATQYVAIRLAVSAVLSVLHEWQVKTHKETHQVSSSKIAEYFKTNDTMLTDKELELVSSLVLPDQIEDHWAGLGGVHSVKRDLWNIANRLAQDNTSEETAVTALRRPARSVLLYGPPGCGKTVIVRGLAQRLRWPVISIAPSSVLRCYVGESSQLIKAVFSLASKLRHCVVVVDEMDSLFSTREDRDSTPNRLDRQLMTEFMTLWDELKRRNETTLVVGLTNRPQDLDPAVQRRFERSFHLGLPDAEQREHIFRSLLRHVHKQKDFDFQRCAQLTQHFSSSDIAELCKLALEQHEQRIELRRQAAERKADAIRQGKTMLTHNVTKHVEPVQDTGLSTMDVSLARQSYVPVAWSAGAFQSSSVPVPKEAQSTTSPAKFWGSNRDDDLNYSEDDNYDDNDEDS